MRYSPVVARKGSHRRGVGTAHFGLVRALNEPRVRRRLGPAQPDELRRLARLAREISSHSGCSDVMRL